MSALASLFEDAGVRLATHRTLHMPGELDDSAILIRSGIACLYRQSDHGHLRIVAVRYSGEVIVPEELRMRLGVQALIPSVTTRLPPEEFSEALKANAKARVQLEKQAALNYRIALEWLIRATYDAAGRIAHLICETAARSGQEISPDLEFDLPFTQEQLAAITGQTGVNVNRVVRDWERHGIIAGPRRRMMVDWSEINRIGRFDRSYLSL